VNKTIFLSDLDTFSPLVNINCCGPVSSNPQIMGVHSGLLDSTIGKWAVIKLCSESTNAGASTIDFTYPDGSLGYYAGRICFNNYYGEMAFFAYNCAQASSDYNANAAQLFLTDANVESRRTLIVKDSGNANTMITLDNSLGSITANGNLISVSGGISIGTTAPTSIFQITGTGTRNTFATAPKGILAGVGPNANDYGISINAAASSGNAIIDFGLASATYKGRILYNNTNNSMTFSTNGTQKIMLSTAGNFGIGSTMTSPTYLLHLSGDSAAKPGTNTWTINSDIRLKEDIVAADLELCYDKIKQLPLKYYKWKDDVYTTDEVKDRH
jgi:hypothetical protein